MVIKMKKGVIVFIILIIISILVKPQNEQEIYKTEEIAYYKVEIVGEVNRPGIYEVPYGTKKQEVIKLAGEKVNSVYWFSDDIVTKDLTIEVLKRIDNPIKINEASLEELDSLPGIGITTAKKIIDYLNTKKITSWNDFKKVAEVSNDEMLEIMVRAII